MCEDMAGYVDSQGLNCSSHIGYDCRNKQLFTEELGYSSEDWQDMVESCPKSCGLCEGSGEAWSARATTTHCDDCTSFFPPSCFRWMSLDELLLLSSVVGDIEAPPTLICSDSCEYSKSRQCNDGGSGSTSNICAFGTDCEVGLPSKNDHSKHCGFVPTLGPSHYTFSFFPNTLSSDDRTVAYAQVTYPVSRM
jgi:hypothetical protein